MTANDPAPREAVPLRPLPERHSATDRDRQRSGPVGAGTDRARTEEALRSSEARLEAGAALAGLGFYEIDYGQQTMYADDRVRELVGLSAGQGDGLQVLQTWLTHLHPADRQSVLEVRQNLHDGRQDQLSAEYRFEHPTRGVIWIHHLAAVSARDGKRAAVKTFGVLRDVTPQKRTEHELRDLGRRLIHAHEEERAVLARELHDDLTQRLAVLAIEVGRAEQRTTEPAQTDALRTVREGLVRLSEDVHSLAYQLHPSVLEELGLVQALRAECDRLARSLEAELTVDAAAERAAGTSALGKDTALCLFRVAQEALNNIVRHAAASAAHVSLTVRDGGLALAVRDEGVGFDPGSPAKGPSLGLVGMRERVRLLDGTLEIDSEPGRGTSILAWVPARGGAQ